jgi:predicted ATPase/DNA-binding CsgD family transcriptional regulator/tetratricopeptide (TPR) repeat protein
VQGTDLRTDDVWVGGVRRAAAQDRHPVLGLTWQDAFMTRLHGGPPERLAQAGVTEREAEVLSAVAERLHNREIADRLYISVRTVESHVSALLRKLDVTDRAALVAVGAELGRAAQPGPALPVPLTSFVGRERETDEIAALLQGHRLLTLTGPAGAGKTRLALQVAASGAEGLPDDVRLADLAAVASADLVADTLARALGVSPQPTRPVRESLRDAARELQGLLLVDNCEHVVGEAAELLSDLLTAGGQLRVMATSREVLGVPGEVSYEVQPLPVPSPQASSRAAAAGGYDAVRLFVDRARHASPGFALTDTNAAAVAALCQRLDGLPLAIELAASRVRSFPPATLLVHLDQRFELLTAGARTVLPRHRTLRAAIDWSYDLLGEDERALFDRLGVFPADFDYDAVEAVCATSGSAGATVVRLLPALVDKSLVSTAGGDPPRYRLLESLRAYAATRLAGRGADTDVRQRHAAHYLAVAELAAGRLRGPEQRAWLDRLMIEQPNLRAALAHIVASGDVETSLRWISALELFWDGTGQRREAHEWIWRTLACGEPPATPAAVAGLAAASTLLQPWDDQAALELAQRAAQLASQLGDTERARAAAAVGMAATYGVRSELALPALHEALALFGDEHPWERARALQGLALATAEPAAEALGWARESLALFRRVGDRIRVANTLFVMAARSIDVGVADDEVQGWLTESLALSEAAGSDHERAHALLGFGRLAWLRGDRDYAVQLLEECVPIMRRPGDQRCTGRGLHLLGEQAREHQQLVRAEELLRGSVEAAEPAGEGTVVVDALEALAAVLSATDRPREAAVLIGAADAQRGSGSTSQRSPQAPDQNLRRSLIRGLGRTTFDETHTHGRSLSPTAALRLTTSASPTKNLNSKNPNSA